MSGIEGKNGGPSFDDLNASKYSAFINSQFNQSRASQNGLPTPRGSTDPTLQDAAVFDQAADTPYETASDQQRGSYDSAQSQLSDLAPNSQIPDIKSFNPEKGPNGCPVTIYLSADYDLESSSALISLSFATKQILVNVSRLSSSGALFEYVILTNAPELAETGSATTQVEIKLHMQEATGQHIGSVNVGTFEYTAGSHYQSTHNSGRKRKMSEEDEVITGRTSYPYANQISSAYPQNLSSIDIQTANRRFAPFGRSQNQQRYRDPYSMPAALPSQSLMRPMSQDSNWSSHLTSYSGRSPGFPGETQTVSLSTSENTPMLVRTTALGQNGSPGGNPAGPSGFNPYLYPQKAVLKIHGDLCDMANDWTADEFNAKRRLVQFTRSQSKSTINASFAPVAPEDRQPNSICVSCIWWEERQECYATSVDTISLLESLVAMRFTVEEKNRIRRNLEGFHPETVSKGKADSEEFFKIIMGFPNPKPRNIEKDVKVFPWKILGHALKKIISKYSASYSSTAGALGTPRSSTSYYDAPSFGRSASDGAAQTPYTPTMRASTMSPHGIPSHLTDTPLSASLPSISSEYTLSTVPSPYTDSQYFPSPNIYTHHRTASATEYDAPRQYKRPRASTTNALPYHHEAANILGDMNMSRSLSDHGSNARLPSLGDGYGQVTSGMQQNPMSARGSYDFGSFLDQATAHPDAQ